MIDYKNLKVKTGDVVEFSGRGLFSKIIQLVDGGRSSHVGIIYRCPLTNAIFILESTSLYKGVKGVQLNLLGERVRTYKGRLWIRRLSVKVSESQLNDLQHWIECNRHTSYETGLSGLLELFNSAVDLPFFFKNKPDQSEIFCSELVAIIFKLWGFLSKDLIENEFSPNDFRDGINKKLIGVRLGKAIQIK